MPESGKHGGPLSETNHINNKRTGHAALVLQAGDWLFLAWVALVPIMQPFHVRVAGRFWMQPADALFPLVAIAFTLSVIQRTRRIERSGFTVLLFGYLVALGISAIMSENPHASLLKLPAAGYVVLGALFTYMYVTSRATLRRVLSAWQIGVWLTIAATAVAIGLHAIGFRDQHHNLLLSHFGTLPSGPYPRIRDLFLNANMLGSYAASSAMLAIGARQIGAVGPSVGSLLLTGSIVTAIFSLSPGNGGLILALGLWMARPCGQSAAVRRFWFWAGLTAAVGFYAGTWIDPTPLRNSSVWHLILHPTASARVHLWSQSWQTFLRNPILGRGLDIAPADLHYLTVNGTIQHLTEAHNSWLSLLAQTGIVGGGVFIFLTAFMTARLRFFKQDCSGIRAAIELAFVGGVLYQMLTCSLETTRHVWIVTGLLAAVYSLDINELATANPNGAITRSASARSAVPPFAAVL